MKENVSFLGIMNLLILLCYYTSTLAQETICLETNSIVNYNIKEEALSEYLSPKIEQSQFILLGESQGIVEVGELMPMYRKLDEETKAFIFKFDLIILINDTTPHSNF